jgi:hypothetical protein
MTRRRGSDTRLFRRVSLLVAVVVTFFLVFAKPATIGPYTLGLVAIWLTATFGWKGTADATGDKARRMGKGFARQISKLEEYSDNSDEGEDLGATNDTRRRLHGHLWPSHSLRPRAT